MRLTQATGLIFGALRRLLGRLAGAHPSVLAVTNHRADVAVRRI